MQKLTIVRYTTKPDCSDENEALTRRVFTQLRAEAPKGIAYMVFRKDSEFFHVFVNTVDDNSSPLTDLEAFKAFSAGGEQRWIARPVIIREGVTLIDTYGLRAEG